MKLRAKRRALPRHLVAGPKDRKADDAGDLLPLAMDQQWLTLRLLLKWRTAWLGRRVGAFYLRRAVRGLLRVNPRVDELKLHQLEGLQLVPVWGVRPKQR